MSLNWNIEKIHERLIVDGKMDSVTEALIWATMAVDIGDITEKNWKEFYFRVKCVEMLNGPFLSTVDEHEEIQERPLTIQDVKRHIGLHTNVCTTTHAQFLRAFAKRVDYEISHRVSYDEEKLEEVKV